MLPQNFRRERRMLEVKDLKKCFITNSRRRLWAVNGISFNVKKNEVLGVVGESGCGKSTLARLILRLVEPSAGQVFFDEKEITGISRKTLRPIRKDLQMVFQNPYASFNPKIRIDKALMEVCRYYGMSISESREKIEKLLNDTGLSGDLLNRWPRELSGGQLQRLAIARSLLSEPSLLVADEPLASLDVSVQSQLLNLLEDIRSSRSMTMIFISHDMNVVEYFCDMVAVMYLGIIMEMIPASELSCNSLHPYTRSLRDCAPRLDVFKDSSVNLKNIIHGDIASATAQIPGCPFAPRCPQAKPQCSQNFPQLREISDRHSIRCHLT